LLSLLKSLSKLSSTLLALVKAEIITPVGFANLTISGLLAYLTYSLKGDTFSQSTLDWAADVNLGGWVLLPLVIGVVLTALMLLASLVLIYMEGSHRRR
jgi:TRAP-type C4-dicarboxylate transport system permease small subunit